MQRYLIILLIALTFKAHAVPERIAEGVYLLRDTFEPSSQPDGNSVLLRGPQGWVLFDSGRHAAHTQALLDFTAGELRAVINSHWHLDHLGGNVLLRQAQPGLRIYASPAVDKALSGWLAKSREDMLADMKDNRVPEDAKAQMRIDLALLSEPSALAPNVHLSGPAELKPAGRALRVGLEAAVSGGDVWALDLASKTLMSGDLVTFPVPFFDTACASDWSAALGRLEALPFERLVPGHGRVMNAAEVHLYHDALDGLLACAASDKPVAACSADWVGALDGLIAEADKPRVTPMLGYYFNAHLRAAPAQRERFCGSISTQP